MPKAFKYVYLPKENTVKNLGGVNSRELRWLEALGVGICQSDKIGAVKLSHTDLATLRVGESHLYRAGIIYNGSIEYREICPGTNLLLAHVVHDICVSASEVLVLFRMTMEPYDIGARRVIEAVRPPNVRGWWPSVQTIKELEQNFVFDPTTRRFRTKPLATVHPIGARRISS